MEEGGLEGVAKEKAKAFEEIGAIGFFEEEGGAGGGANGVLDI